MLDIKTILVAKDFSPSSRQALTYAVDLAHRTGATLHSLYAEVLHGDLYGEAADSDFEDEMRKQLVESVASSVREREGGTGPAIPVVHSVVRDLAAAPAILEYAGKHDVDLIVMGTHGRRGFRRLFLGSVAEEVVRLAPCPVFTIRSESETVPTHLNIRTILVPIDFSPHSAEALKRAAELATLYQARLALLHVVEDRLHPGFYNASLLSVYEVEPDIEQKATHQLQEFMRATIGTEYDARMYVVPGNPAHAIASFAGKHDIDMIVMSTHGLTGLEHFLMGSVAEKVVRNAPCPVLTLKAFAPEHVLREAREMEREVM